MHMHDECQHLSALHEYQCYTEHMRLGMPFPNVSDKSTWVQARCTIAMTLDIAYASI
jgi:hypothetical protein